MRPIAGAVLAALLSAGVVVSPEPGRWVWPGATPRQVTEAYREPAHEYGPGHRGIDVAADRTVRSPADGVIAFSGTVVDRPLVTIDHGAGLVVTLEPVATELRAGDVVRAGDPVGVLSVGGHAEPGHLHIGARSHGDYIDPLPLFGRMPLAVLLPCCDPP